MRRLLVAGCAVLAMAGCVTPLQDSSSAQSCKQHGFQENTEDFTICRKWRNAETAAADPENFGLFVTKGFSQFACEDHHKLTIGTEEYDKCIDKYKSIGAEKNKYIQAQQNQVIKEVIDQDRYKCESYGLQKGTPAFVDCMMKQEDQRKSDSLISSSFQMEQQKLEMQRKRDQAAYLLKAQEMNKPSFSPSINCTTTHGSSSSHTHCN